MQIIFWTSFFFILYAYIGYTFALYLLRQVSVRQVQKRRIYPSMSVVIAARDEAGVIASKIENILRLDYPKDRLEVIVVSDGSRDGTDRVLRRILDPRVKAFHFPEHRGKAQALNLALSNARGEVVVFTDARQEIAVDALSELTSNFADPSVGAASGELILKQAEQGFSNGIGLYWRYEKCIRQYESETGSVIGATGALYAAKRELIPTLPTGLILDDVFVPLNICRQGYRVVLDRTAHVFDRASQGSDDEFPRKVRTSRGIWQLVHLCPWLLLPSRTSVQFFSHKLARLLVPLFLVLLLISNVWLVRTTPQYALMAGAQFVFYGLVLVRQRSDPGTLLARLTWLPSVFLSLNAAALVSVLQPSLAGKWCTDNKAAPPSEPVYLDKAA